MFLQTSYISYYPSAQNQILYQMAMIGIKQMKRWSIAPLKEQKIFCSFIIDFLLLEKSLLFILIPQLIPTSLKRMITIGRPEKRYQEVVGVW